MLSVKKISVCFMLVAMTLVSSCVAQLQNLVPPASALPAPATKISPTAKATAVLSTPQTTLTLNAGELPVPPTVPPVLFMPERGNFSLLRDDEIKKRLSTRRDAKKNDLSLTIKLLNLELDDLQRPLVISVFAEFRNQSDRPLIFKIPRRTGFWGSGPQTLGGPYNDLVIGMRRKDRQEIYCSETSELLSEEYSHRLEFSSLDNDLYHRPENFGVIAAGGTVSFLYTYDMPAITFKDDYLMGTPLPPNTLPPDYQNPRIPPGTYFVAAEYLNIAVGYQYPVQEPQKINFDNLTFSNTLFADIDAWVGHIRSNEVEIIIP